MLTPQEADKLFETLERLRSEGKSILYISHRLEEVKRMCDRATVHAPRQGRRPLRSAQGDRRLARPHDGRQRGPGGGARAGRRASTRQQPLLEIREPQPQAGDAVLDAARKNINLDVRAGEVIGIAGVAGNGQGEFFEAVSGEALQQEAEHDPHPRQGRRAAATITGRRLLGAAFVPEERLGHGAAPRMKLSENLLLSRYATDRKAFLGAGGLVKDGRRSTRPRSASSR